MKMKKFFAICSMFVMLVSLLGVVPAGAAPSGPQVISDEALKAMFTSIGGADVLPTTRTVAHWFGSTLDPNNGVTYGYNMVGADPYNCSGAACSVTIETDIIPIILNVGGLTFNGNDVLAATLDSPQFALNDYGKTRAATSSDFTKGKGGTLSQTNAGQQLQLQDVTMRSQFNKTGNYHLILHANVLPTVTINVPANQGTLLQSGRGVVFADVSYSWWTTQVQNLETKADPTHLPIYLTDNVLLHIGSDIFNCCVIGFHGTRAAGSGGGSNNSNGNAVVQTFAWA